MKNRTLSDSAASGIEIAVKDLDQEIFFSRHPDEHHGPAIKPGQLVSYEVEFREGQYRAVNLKVIGEGDEGDWSSQSPSLC